MRQSETAPVAAFFWVSGFFRCMQNFQAKSLHNLKMKKRGSETPLNCVRNILIFALNDFISISFEVIRDLIYILPYCPNELAFTLRSVRTVHYDDMVRAALPQSDTFKKRSEREWSDYAEHCFFA